MPKYDNHSKGFKGGEFLKVPPDSTGHEGIYFYPSNADLTMYDVPPYYNPVKLKDVHVFSGETEHMVDIPMNLLDGDKHLVIYTQCSVNTYNAIEIMFNSENNLPSLPLTNSEFALNNYNRIKRIYIKTNEGDGEVLVMIVDKYVPSITSLGEPSSPNKSAGN
jgi:hypothetical protein